jgi:drug/metabolite transporter (DMT)-like permease
VKIGLDYLPPFTYAALRVASAFVTTVALLGFGRRLRWPARDDLPIVFSVGIGQVVAGVLIMNIALQVVPAGRSSVLYYTMPLWVAVMLAVVYRVLPRRFEVVGLILGIAGIVALLSSTAINLGAADELAGTLLLLTNAVIWAGVTIHIRRHRWVGNPLDLSPWQLLVALVPIVVVAVVLERDQPVRWELATVLVLLFSGPLATSFATWASQSITRSLGSQATGTGFLAVPVVGLASGALILGESLSPVDVIGFGLVLGGIAVATIKSTAQTEDESAPPARLDS